MTYYNIGSTNEIDVIGNYPQTQRTKRLGYHVDDVNSELKVKSDVFPKFHPKYGLDLHPKSKETDVLDRGTLDFGFVVSNKLKTLLGKFKLPPHKFYRIDVYGTSKDYYWFHTITDFATFFDVRKSEIEIFDILTLEVTENILFESLTGLNEYRKKLVMEAGKIMRYKSIQLNSTFPNYDLFEIQGAQYFTLISNKLKKTFEQEGITGLECLEYDKISIAT